jgi:phage terminase large subunit-like protein
MAYMRKTDFYGKTPQARANQLANLKHRHKTPKLLSENSKPTKAPNHYPDDPPLFIEDHFYVVETRAPMVLLDWQKELLTDILLSKPTKNLAVIGQPKKTGKSSLGAAVALWYLTNKDMAEVYLLASDIGQTALVAFDKMVKSIRMNKVLRDCCKILPGKGRIEFQDSFVQILAPNTSVAGINPSMILAEELWSWTTNEHKRSWDELTNTPTREDNLNWVTSYAGHSEDEDSILWDLYSKGIAQQEGREEKDPRFYFRWFGEELYERVPWVKPSYLPQQKKRLRPNSYARLHCNQWASCLESFTTTEVVDLCTMEDHQRGAITDKPVCLGIDIGLKHDASAVTVVGAVDDATLGLFDHAIWAPRPGQVLDLEKTVEAVLEVFSKTYKIRRCYYDPFQFARSAATLRKKGLPMFEYPQTVANLCAMTSALSGVLTSAKLVLYADRDIRQHLLNAQIKEHERGWRLVKGRQSGKIDLAVSLAMAVQAAQDCFLLRGGSGVSFSPDYGDDDEDDDGIWRTVGYVNLGFERA